jgi:hypothetical protein
MWWRCIEPQAGSAMALPADYVEANSTLLITRPPASEPNRWPGDWI